MGKYVASDLLGSSVLSRWLWERGEKGGASLQKQAHDYLVYTHKNCTVF